MTEPLQFHTTTCFNKRYGNGELGRPVAEQNAEYLKRRQERENRNKVD